jgi:excisionase family DNA binding protein
MKKSEIKELYNMMFPDFPDIVTVTQLQEMLGVSRHLAYDLINDGSIRGLKIGNAFKIPKVNVIEYVMDQKRVAVIGSI